MKSVTKKFGIGTFSFLLKEGFMKISLMIFGTTLFFIGYILLFNKCQESTEFKVASHQASDNLDTLKTINENLVNSSSLPNTVSGKSNKTIDSANQDENREPEKLSLEERMTEMAKKIHTNNHLILRESLLEGEDAAMQLKGLLSLNDNEYDHLKTLLLDKIKNDLKITKSKYEDALNHSNNLYQQNRLNYENQLSSVLTKTQMETYFRFEQERYKRVFDDHAFRQATRIIETLPNLTEYQKEEIYRVYNSPNIELKEIGIGTYGTPRHNKYKIWAVANLDIPIFETKHIESILDQEQLDVFKKL
ncbi:hypothetical protein [Glaciecola sp. 1036]|uniref:hypothetical protein n=1 Tax=Alteromonadaceae TaxID=72275 RepID=UPI003D06D87D